MSSTNREGVGPLRKGQLIKARDLEGLRDGRASAPLIRQPGTLTKHFPSGQMSQPVTAPSTAGTALYYFEITASTNISTYTATRYDNPIDRNSIETGVTIRAMRHTAGTLPNSAAGKGHWCAKVGGVYYILDYGVFEG